MYKSIFSDISLRLYFNFVSRPLSNAEATNEMVSWHFNILNESFDFHRAESIFFQIRRREISVTGPTLTRETLFSFVTDPDTIFVLAFRRIFSRCQDMWIVRQISLLMVMVAMLLPSAFFRDCCCSRRARLEQSSKQQMKPCCKARLARLAAAAAKDPLPKLTPPSCQCRAKVATATLPDKKVRVQTESNQIIADALDPSQSFNVAVQPPKVLTDFSRSDHASDPPLRVTFCRWAI